MADAIIIFPNGDITDNPATVAELRRSMNAASISVVILRSPVTDAHSPGETTVGYIFDWGRVEGMPVNLKAWALYGRSPIHGPCIVQLDSNRSLPDDFVAKVRLPIGEWGLPPRTVEILLDELGR